MARTQLRSALIGKLLSLPLIITNYPPTQTIYYTIHTKRPQNTTSHTVYYPNQFCVSQQSQHQNKETPHRQKPQQHHEFHGWFVFRTQTFRCDLSCSSSHWVDWIHAKRYDQASNIWSHSYAYHGTLSLNSRSDKKHQKKYRKSKEHSGAFASSSEDEGFSSSHHSSDSSVSEIDSSDEDDDHAKCAKRHRERRGMRVRAKTLRDITQDQEEEKQQRASTRRNLIINASQNKGLPTSSSYGTVGSLDESVDSAGLSPRDTKSTQKTDKNRGSFCV